MYAQRALLLFIFTVAATSTGHAQTPGILPADAAEIRAESDNLIAAWNLHDMKAYVRDMAEDVEWVNVRGSVWRGKEQVYREHLHLHETIFKTRQLHPPETFAMRAVAPGVVIVTSIGLADAFTTPSGHAEPAGLNTLTETFVKRGTHWVLVEGHNTPVIQSGGPHP